MSRLGRHFNGGPELVLANAERSRQQSSCTSMWMACGRRLKLQQRRFDLNLSSCAALILMTLSWPMLTDSNSFLWSIMHVVMFSLRCSATHFFGSSGCSCFCDEYFHLETRHNNSLFPLCLQYCCFYHVNLSGALKLSLWICFILWIFWLTFDAWKGLMPLVSLLCMRFIFYFSIVIIMVMHSCNSTPLKFLNNW